MENYGLRRLKKVPYIALTALIFIIAASVLLFLGIWRMSVVALLLGLAGVFLALAFREEKESRICWLLGIYIFFGGTFMLALIAQLIYVIVTKWII